MRFLVSTCKLLRLSASLASSNGQLIISQQVRAMAAFKGGTQSTGKRRFRLPTKTDATYLVKNVGGSNIYREGDDVKIKDDSEYPDWIWTMNLGRPPRAEELEYGTKEYWETLDHESKIRSLRFRKVKHKETMRVGQVEQDKMEWQNRIKFRALATFNHEPGYDPEDLKPQPNKKLWLKPQEDEEELYPDLYAAENPWKFKDHERIGVKTECQINRKFTRKYR